MKLLFNWMSKSSCRFISLKKNFATGYNCCTSEIKMSQVSTDSKIEPPSKKLCLDEENGQNKTEENNLEIKAEIKDGAEPKIRHKKTALLLGYIGDGYYGMQLNPVFRTVEGEVLAALDKAGFIRSTGVKEPVTIKFQRTTRTDRGVSAAKQLVSLEMAENFCVESVNKLLPEDIRLFAAKKVTKNFNCKNQCNARTYSYTLPTFALAPELHKEYPEKYRIDDETLKKVNDVLGSYVGTHRFHNFTSKKKYSDPSVRRFMVYVKAEEPFLENGEEFISLKIKGQSFMFHQIRKMVGHMIAVLKGVAPEDIQTEVWKDKHYSVPLAPGIGLLLEDVHFDLYNRRFGSDGIHVPLDWSEVADKVNEFRSFILSHIIKKELESRSMFNWILQLSLHSYDCSTRSDYFENNLDEEEIPEEENHQTA